MRDRDFVPIVEPRSFQLPVIDRKSGPTRCKVEPVARQSRPTFPVFGGISGSTRTIYEPSNNLVYTSSYTPSTTTLTLPKSTIAMFTPFVVYTGALQNFNTNGENGTGFLSGISNGMGSSRSQISRSKSSRSRARPLFFWWDWRD